MPALHRADRAESPRHYHQLRPAGHLSQCRVVASTYLTSRHLAATLQVILKPEPGNPQELFLKSLEAIGIDTVRFGSAGNNSSVGVLLASCGRSGQAAGRGAMACHASMRDVSSKSRLPSIS